MQAHTELTHKYKHTYVQLCDMCVILPILLMGAFFTWRSAQQDWDENFLDQGSPSVVDGFPRSRCLPVLPMEAPRAGNSKAHHSCHQSVSGSAKKSVSQTFTGI